MLGTNKKKIIIPNISVDLSQSFLFSYLSFNASIEIEIYKIQGLRLKYTFCL